MSPSTRRPTRTSVYLVEEHRTIREGLELLLGSVGAIVVTDLSRADVGLVDWSCESSRSALRALRDRGVRTVAFARPMTPVRALSALEQGVDVVISDEDSLERLTEALTDASAPSLLGDLGAKVAKVLLARSKHPAITAREREVLELYCQPLSTDEIARDLEISRVTVRNHLDRIQVKLAAHSRRAILPRARELGYVS